MRAIRGSLSLEWYDVLKSFTYLCNELPLLRGIILNDLGHYEKICSYILSTPSLRGLRRRTEW